MALCIKLLSLFFTFQLLFRHKITGVTPVYSSRRSLEGNPTKFPFSKISQDSERCLVSVTIEQLQSKFLNISEVQKIQSKLIRNNNILKTELNQAVLRD